MAAIDALMQNIEFPAQVIPGKLPLFGSEAIRVGRDDLDEVGAIWKEDFWAKMDKIHVIENVTKTRNER